MKNTHLEHPEDELLNNGREGAKNILRFLRERNNKLSVKYDGAPAIVWGTCPSTGKFFVGTKSVFNKVKIKINYNHFDISQNHEGNVASILHVCFDNLPHIKGIVQGDFIGFGGNDFYINGMPGPVNGKQILAHILCQEQAMSTQTIMQIER